MHEQQTAAKSSTELIFIGIDWADCEHVVCLIDERGQTHISTLQQSPQAIDEWVAGLQKNFPGKTFAVAVEQSKGPLIYALMKYDVLVIYPINPKQLSRYRDAIYPSGSKNDPGDAKLIARFLKLHFDGLRAWKPDTLATRKLANLTEIRRKIVEERKRLTQQFTGTLKQYFPLMLELEPQRTELMLAVVRRWSTLQQLRRARPATLRSFLAEHGLRNEQRQTAWIESVRDAVPLTGDKAIIDPHALYAQSLAEQLQKLIKTIAEFDKQIAATTALHPDEKIFRSLPGAGDALVPRLIAAFGTDRDRFASAEEIQSYSGIAPVTRQSGKTCYVSCRYACPKFLRQTFHEFADHARKWSSWSTAFYQQRRAAGYKHQAAVRALAYKWIRIIYRLWKTNTTYSEAHYVAQLKKRNSPLIKLIENA